MRQLYLVRHAKSDWERGVADFDRPLNKRGKRDAPQMGKRLKALGVNPDLIVSSPAKRAISTARKVADELSYDRDRIVLDETLYEAFPEDTLRVIQGMDAAHTSVMVFGHNPTMTELVNRIPKAEIDNVPTCGVASVTFETDDWSDVDLTRGTLVFFEYPKLLS